MHCFHTLLSPRSAHLSKQKKNGGVAVKEEPQIGLGKDNITGAESQNSS